MNASKENCQIALDVLTTMERLGFITSSGNTLFLRDFLIAARKRLPSEEAIARDRNRRKKPTLSRAESRGRGLSG